MAWLFFAVTVAVIFYVRIAEDQHRQALKEAAEHREELRQLVISESKQLNYVLGNFIAKSETAAYVEADLKGKVTFLNKRAAAELAVDVGEPIEACMQPESGEGHRNTYQAAMKSHDRRKPSTASRVGLVKSPDGEWHKARVESWTTLDGSRAFITRLE